MGGKKKKMQKLKPNANCEIKDTSTVENDSEIENLNNFDKKSQKRKLVENEINDNATETQHKQAKKKKTQPVQSSGTKNKKSNRQLKKEKHAERQAAAAAVAKDQLKSQCLNYLSQWKHDKDNWKFMKAKQVWLLKNKFSSSLIPDASWPILLEYFESAKGNVRNILLADANKIIKQMDDWTESQSNEQDKNDTSTNLDTEDSQDSTIVKPEDTVYKRARSLIQCLEE
ncbi:uncharacterized protein C7orf50 homolog [Battus philenor]|uniref:uncharacterized protein C7orf50 homolog n=1 Tax=Battus philenor TaxID=42288 RepID=UPI0035CFF117